MYESSSANPGKIGSSKSLVKVFNISTGKPVKVCPLVSSPRGAILYLFSQGGSSKLASSALCLAFDSAHSQLWVGDSKVSDYACTSPSVTRKPFRAQCTTSVLIASLANFNGSRGQSSGHRVPLA